jgi:hypothetical protein
MQAEKITKTDIEILSIRREDVKEFWPLVHFMVAEALTTVLALLLLQILERIVYQDICNYLLLMEKNLKMKETKVYAIAITRVTQLPNKKQLEGIICTGHRRELWQKPMAEMMELFAKQSDCNRISMLMRPGWKKIMGQFGWTMKHVEMQKELN